jgi:hypothetical protein
VRSRWGGQQCPAWQNRNTLSIETGLIAGAVSETLIAHPLNSERALPRE